MFYKKEIMEEIKDDFGYRYFNHDYVFALMVALAGFLSWIIVISIFTGSKENK